MAARAPQGKFKFCITISLINAKRREIIKVVFLIQINGGASAAGKSKFYNYFKKVCILSKWRWKRRRENYSLYNYLTKLLEDL